MRSSGHMGAKPRHTKDQATPFDVDAFLESAGASRRIMRFACNRVIFAQGAQATAVFYIQEGGVKLTVLSTAGKEAVVAMLGRATSSAKVPRRTASAR